ncbi:MAG: IgA Peptidase M64 [Acidobacteria bacterium]|nr:IgA Peptidase M64 [Acidobacteriota bacterium]
MKLSRVAAITSLVAATLGLARSSADSFDKLFESGTMRVDYFHTGGPGVAEAIALDRVVADGPWPGSRTRLVDETNLGKYFFEVIDRATNGTIFSRGFASIYGEWETTDEIRHAARTFHESLRFPWPKIPVQVILKKRDRDNSFREIWSTVVDPRSRFVNRAVAKPEGTVWTLFESGPAATKVDLLVLGDGYTASELPKFHRDAQRLIGALFALEPYKSRKSDFNVRAIDLPTPESGVTRSRAQIFRRTRLSAEFNIFDLERYLLTYDNRALRDVASAAPYEFIEILVNEAHYGGGGIYNFQATASVDSQYSAYVFIHEFGHHFAGLADEYYTSEVAYETGAPEHPEPWEPNVTALHDPQALKWRDLVEPGTPLPTPWDKAEFEAHSREYQAKRRALLARNAPQAELDALFKQAEEWETKFLSSMRYSGKVGAFEGASYEAKGLYRSQADCTMFTRDRVGFCRVCRRAIERVVEEYVK